MAFKPYLGNFRVFAISADPEGEYVVLGGQSTGEVSAEMEEAEVNVKTDTHAKSLPGIMSGSLSFEAYESEEEDEAQALLETSFQNRRLVYVEEGKWSGVGEIADSYQPVKRSEGYITSYERSLEQNEAVSLSLEVSLQKPWVTVGLNVSPSTASITVSGTQQLTVNDSDGTNRTSSATYSSSNESIATVSTGGLITGVAAGTATITANYGGKAGTCVVTVTA